MGGIEINQPLWIPTPEQNVVTSFAWWRNYKKHFCVLSVLIAFGIGFVIGLICSTKHSTINTSAKKNELNKMHNVQFMDEENSTNVYFEDGVFWGREIEALIPGGFQPSDTNQWASYVNNATAVRLEPGCGRMQNRMVVFQDGNRGCVRYRQNFDQIQGELFSFYLAELLGLRNLAPSTVSLIDLSSTTWARVSSDIASAQWSSNRPVVVTKFIPNLSPAPIPRDYRFTPERRLTPEHLLQTELPDLIELAQWSDLIVFDYLTGNLDRVVNNLYNRQWNVNIMSAPAHNLAKRDADDLLVFLDNESGLLHGYRLLRKYEPYHSLLLDNLCLFRRRTVEMLERLRAAGNDVGALLVGLFQTKTNVRIRDVLAPLPDKSVKILKERLERVHSHVAKCKRDAN